MNHHCARLFVSAFLIVFHAVDLIFTVASINPSPMYEIRLELTVIALPPL